MPAPVSGRQPMQSTRNARTSAAKSGNHRGDGLPDILAPGLDVVFCGINPGRRAVASGHHFDGRGNRFWRVLYLAGFTPVSMTPAQDRLLPALGCGLATVVGRATASASELAAHEFAAAAEGFVAKIRACEPRHLAFLGKAAYAGMTGRQELAWGRQAELFAGAQAWVLPNPSGLNRAFSLDDLVAAYKALRVASASGPAKRP